MKCTYKIIINICLEICKKHVMPKKSPRKHQIPRDRRALMRKRSKLQKKIQMSTNHQTKENVLNHIKKIENNLKISINTEINLRETRAVAAIKNNPKYFYKFVEKTTHMMRTGIGPLQDEEGNLEPSNKKMTKLLNEQYNSAFSTLHPTMTIKYPKDFFGHPQGNTLPDINIKREHIDAIQTISQNSSGGPDEFPAILLKQCSKSLAHPLQLLYKASLKTGKIPTILNQPLLHQYTKMAPGTFPRTTVVLPLHNI